MTLIGQRSMRRAFALALAALVVAPSAFGQGWLVGASFGDTRQFDYDVGGPIATVDDSDTGQRVFGGYLFSPVQGVVVSWVDLGAAYYDGPAFGGFTDTLTADGVDLSYVLGFAPGVQSRVTLFSMIGLFTWKQDVHYVDDSGVYDYNDSGTSISYGVGTEIKLGGGDVSAWGLHFEWQRFRDVGDNNNSGHEYDREMVSIGVDYRFGK